MRLVPLALSLAALACSSSQGGGSGDHGSSEICGNGLDDDRDGSVDDGCGCEMGQTQSCYPGDPTNAGIGACVRGVATCADDGSGAARWGDCVGAVLPEPSDDCNWIDDDCDGTEDEGCACDAPDSRACYGGADGTEDIGPCVGGTQSCVDSPDGGRWGDCEGQILPEDDRCDGADQDCDGDADDACPCVVGTTQACWTGSPETRGVGACTDGSQTCVAIDSGASSEWGPCGGEVPPVAESCNGADDDCDGAADEGIADADGDGFASPVCGGDDCDDADPTIHPGATDSRPEIETVGDGGTGVSMELDGDDAVHVSYFNGRAPQYATNESGDWVVRSIGGLQDTEFETALALDDAGAAHVIHSYAVGGGEDLYYATNESGVWVSSFLDTTGDTGYSLSLVADSVGDLHASYVRVDSSEVRYAHRTGGVWTPSTIDSDVQPGYGTAIALDALDTPHVTYVGVSSDLRHATGGGWAYETVDEDASHYSSLAIEDDETLHVSYLDSRDGVLLYARDDGAGWTIETVDETADDNVWTSLVVDGGVVSIAYSVNDGQVTYATKIDGRWLIGLVEDTRTFAMSLALASDGVVHIAYRNNDLNELHHATIAPADGIDSDCDGVEW